jgi:hypothetical protein
MLRGRGSWACLLGFFSLGLSAATAAQSPVVLLNGLAGAALEAKLHKSSSEHIWCSKKADWYVGKQRSPSSSP